MDSPPDISFLTRPYEKQDRDACSRLYREGLLGGKLAENDSGLDIDDIEMAYMSTDGNCFWVAETDDKQVVGMIGVQQHEQSTGEIRRLRVAGEFRRRGIGSKLIEAALRFCEEHNYLKITLDTFTDREPAIKLFEKFRFHHHRTRQVNGRELLYFYLDIYTGGDKGNDKKRHG
jgi:ribosomal protein S18 acetylase RimI-like enzyme